jgi:SSS family transporter
MDIKYIVVGVYFLFMISVGLVFKRLNTDENDYFRAGCSGTWWMVGMSLFMSSISIQTFIANAGVAYKAGFTILLIYLVNSVIFLIFALGLAAWYRQARVTTTAEIVYERFGRSFQQFTVYMAMLYFPVVAGIGLYQLAIFAHVSFGFPIVGLIIAIATIVLIYTLFGGNWAVLAGDFLQGLIMVPMILLVAFLAIRHVGGIETFLDKIKASPQLSADMFFITKNTGGGLYSWQWMVANCMIQFFAMLSMGGGQRFFSCKDGNEARKAALLCLGVSTVCALIYFIPPMVARVMYNDQIMAAEIASPQDSSYVFISKLLLPNGFLPLMVVAMFAAQFSTLDTAMNVNSANFVKNVYPVIVKLFGKTPREDHAYLLGMGRLVTLIMGILIGIMGVYFAKNAGSSGVFETMFRINSMLALPMMCPLFFGFFIRRSPWFAGWTCVGAGMVAVLLCTILGWQTHNMAIAVCLSSMAGFVAAAPFSRFADPASWNHINHLFKKIHTPIIFDSEVAREKDLTIFKIIGVFATIMGAMVWLFLIPENTVEKKFCVVFVAAFIQTIGAILLIIGRKRQT